MIAILDYEDHIFRSYDFEFVCFMKLSPAMYVNQTDICKRQADNSLILLD